MDAERPVGYARVSTSGPADRRQIEEPVRHGYCIRPIHEAARRGRLLAGIAEMGHCLKILLEFLAMDLDAGTPAGGRIFGVRGADSP